MKKLIIPIFVFFTIMFSSVQAQTVFSVQYKSDAKVKVFVHKNPFVLLKEGKGALCLSHTNIYLGSVRVHFKRSFSKSILDLRFQRAGEVKRLNHKIECCASRN